MYELESEGSLRTEQYKKAREDDGDDESRMFDFLSRRVYKLLTDKKRDGYLTHTASSSGEERYLLMKSPLPSSVSNPDTGKPDESSQEHIEIVSRSPGWLRSTQWELTDARDPRNWNEPQTGVAKFLTLHEFEDREDVFSSSEFEAAWKDSAANRNDPRTEDKKLLRLWKQF